MLRTLNLGILAHVDAGKTSLTERLLYTAGVIDEIGSVDDGSTQTDSLALERQRGITIKSAVASFDLGGVTVNLIDTPGHPDFIAEVERALSVLDGAVLVISAVEGVQAQTRVLMRALRRLRIPTLLFINKTDRVGADPARVISSIPLAVVPGDPAAVNVLADNSDEFIAAYVDGTARIADEIASQARQALVYPVFTGSAITGAGIPELIAGIGRFLPTACLGAGSAAQGTVFKVERGPAGEKIAYVRMFSGSIRVRDRLRFGKVTALSVFDRGPAQPAPQVSAGQIGKLHGLAGVRIGDPIGVPRNGSGHSFAPPSLETIVVAVRQRDRGALHAALTQLAEQDPLINLRLTPGDDIALSLYGEVQKEVIEATLSTEYGIEVTFRESTTIHTERVVGTGAAHRIIATDGNPFLATVGLKVEPGTGVTFRLGVELGSMPPAFFTAVEESVHQALRQGVYGWEVTDCAVTMTHSGYWARQSHSHGTFDKSMSSTAGDFRNLTPLVLMDALRQAGTTVHEPIHHFRLELPADTVGAVLPVLAKLRAIPRSQLESCVEGDIPAASVHALQSSLPGLTRGEGVLESAFSHYRPVRGEPPSRV